MYKIRVIVLIKKNTAKRWSSVLLRQIRLANKIANMTHNIILIHVYLIFYLPLSMSQVTADFITLYNNMRDKMSNITRDL